MIRGGAWNNNPENLRASNRNRNNTDNRNNNIGFRLVQSARAAGGRSRADLFMDRSGETAGVHESVSRSPVCVGRSNRGPGVRRIGAGWGHATGPGRCNGSRLQGKRDANRFLDGSQLIVAQCVDSRSQP